MLPFPQQGIIVKERNANRYKNTKQLVLGELHCEGLIAFFNKQMNVLCFICGWTYMDPYWDPKNIYKWKKIG